MTNEGSVARPQLPPSIVDELAECAAYLRIDQDGIPVLLRDICQKLGIAVRRDKQVPKGKAYLAWDRRTQATPTILLPLDPHERWDRFCAAHELAHYFLVSRYDWIPIGAEAYWKTEDICDNFARDLLLPEERIRLWLADVGELSAYLSKCDEIAKTAIMPWKEVATSISTILPVAFFRIVQSERCGGYRVSSSSLPKRVGNSAELNAGSDIVDALRRAKDLANSQQIAQNIMLDDGYFKGTKLGIMLRKKSISCLVARISPASKEIKMAGFYQKA